MNDSILLVGSYPPPIGGCSVHVMRLREALTRSFNVSVIDLYGPVTNNDDAAIVRCGRVKPLNAVRAVLALLRQSAKVVHFHVAGMDAFLYAAYPMLLALRRGTRKIVTIHSGSFVARFENGPLWRRVLLRDVLRRFDKIVTVNLEQQRYLTMIGIDVKNIVVIPAFLPPVASESPRVREAVKSLGDCDRIVLSSGYGLPYYGFTCIADALVSQEARIDRSGLLLCLYNSYDENYVSELERRHAHGLTCVVMRDLTPEEFAWLLQRCDVYVRATDRDGDAVAIREALFYGKLVIASDCVERPANVRLFKTNDSLALARALSLTEHEESIAPSTTTNNELSRLLAIYHEAIER